MEQFHGTGVHFVLGHRVGLEGLHLHDGLAIGVVTHGVSGDLVGAIAQALAGVVDELGGHVLELQRGHGLVEGLQGALHGGDVPLPAIDGLPKLVRGAMKPFLQHAIGVVQQALQAFQIVRGHHQVILQLGGDEQRDLAYNRRIWDFWVSLHGGSKTQTSYGIHTCVIPWSGSTHMMCMVVRIFHLVARQVVPMTR